MSVIIRRLFYRGTGGSGGATDAINVEYDNTASGLAATNVQDAIDELAADSSSGAISQTFNNASWIGPTVDNTYTITIPFSSHGKLNPTITAFEGVVSDFIQVEVSVFLNSASDIEVSVPSTPDLRFTGKLIII